MGHSGIYTSFHNVFTAILLCFLQDADIDSQYKNYSVSTRKSLEAWPGSQLDLGLVCTLCNLLTNGTNFLYVLLEFFLLERNICIVSDFMLNILTDVCLLKYLVPFSICLMSGRVKLSCLANV